VRPLIGVTTAAVTNENGLTYNRAYSPIARAVARAGGLPVLIPTGLDEETLHALYERLDGLLLPGGPDIDPAHYGEAPHPTTVIDAERDALEVPLTRWAVDDGVPLLGICRGHQVVNVALGSSLVQDIRSQLPETTLPHDQEPPRGRPSHDIAIAPDSRLARIVGGVHLAVNSLHHQAVRQAAPGLRVTARSADGVIEATERAGPGFALTVQWHPEDLADSDPAMLALFEALVEAARERARA
jgi:putative glutamine amidotransferase